MKETKDNEANKILAQRKILRTILDKGYKLTVTHTVRTRPKGLFGFLKKPAYEERTEELVLKQATLNTLDRASEVLLAMQEKSGKGWELAHATAKDVAEVAAIFVLGERYNAVEGGDEKELKRLSGLLYNTLKPPQVNEIAMFINANVSDFTTSMRLMRMSVTTTPAARIE